MRLNITVTVHSLACHVPEHDYHYTVDSWADFFKATGTTYLSDFEVHVYVQDQPTSRELADAARRRHDPVSFLRLEQLKRAAREAITPTYDPYPKWYRDLPINIQMPWRNLGCFGVKIGELYFDISKHHRFPWFSLFLNYRGHRVWPFGVIRRRWARFIGDHAASLASDLAYAWWDQNRGAEVGRARHALFKVQGYRIAAYRTVRYGIGGLICKQFGHSKHVEVEDFVAGERDERGRLTDIDGGGVDWFCPRCGKGGRSWF